MSRLPLATGVGKSRDGIIHLLQRDRYKKDLALLGSPKGWTYVTLNRLGEKGRGGDFPPSSMTNLFKKIVIILVNKYNRLIQQYDNYHS